MVAKKVVMFGFVVLIGVGMMGAQSNNWHISPKESKPQVRKQPDSSLCFDKETGRAVSCMPIEAPKELPPCAFGLSRVRVYWPEQPKPPAPSLDIAVTDRWGIIPQGLGGQSAVYITPRTRLACPYERAISLYGDERVRYDAKWRYTDIQNADWQNRDILLKTWDRKRPIEFSAVVEVCDDDGKSNCVVVYTEPERKP